MPATTRYIDTQATYLANHANTGLVGSPWGGPGGIKRALGLAVAGDTINLISGVNALVVNTLKKITHAAVVGGFAADDFVIETTDVTDGDPPDAGGGQGYVVYADPSGLVTWVEVTAGTWNTTALRYVWKDSTHYSGAITAVAASGLAANTAGTLASPITVQGTNAAGVVDEANPAPLNGVGLAAALMTTLGHYIVKNLSIQSPASYGLQLADSGVAEKVAVANSSSYGLYIQGAYCTVSRCSASSCTTGIYMNDVHSRLLNCVSFSNSVNGIRAPGGSIIDGCLVYSNTQNGIATAAGIGQVIRGCVIHGNTRDGINVATASYSRPVIRYNRITRNGGGGTYYGINADAAGAVMEDYNVFYSNDLGSLRNVTAGANSLLAASATEEGYTNLGTTPPNFNLTSLAILRPLDHVAAGAPASNDVAISLDATNKVYVTAGLPPVGTVLPAAANVSTVETYGQASEVAGALNMALYTLISGVVGPTFVLAGHDNYTGGSAGSLTLPTAGYVLTSAWGGPATYGVGGTGSTPTATLTAAGNVWHTASAFGAAGSSVTPSKVGSSITNLTAANLASGVTVDDVGPGTFTHTADYTLIAGVVDASWVVVGHDNYAGGSAGSYPTTATSQAAQLSADQAAVDAGKADIKDTRTILGVTGTLDMGLYTLISGVVGAVDVRFGTARYSGGSTGTCHVPTASQVLSPVAVDATTGNVTLPADGSNVVVGTNFGVTGNSIVGAYPTTATSQAAQLASDQAAVMAGQADIKSSRTILGVTGTLDMSLYTLLSGVVSASFVVVGHDNYTGGAAGTYPTTATSQAAQLAADQAAVTAGKADILNTRTILTVTGTFDLAADEAAQYAAGGAAQLVTDKAAVTAVKATILETTTLLTIPGTLLRANVLVAAGGTFDEAARNTDPGVASVEQGTAYKIQNVALTGTLAITDNHAGIGGSGAAEFDFGGGEETT
jgi:hypothetical protein